MLAVRAIMQMTARPLVTNYARSPRVTEIDLGGPDFFTDNALLADPYAYLAAPREESPVRREAHHDVVMVTGYEESLAVYNDTDRRYDLA
jgi:hypothetical protein